MISLTLRSLALTLFTATTLTGFSQDESFKKNFPTKVEDARPVWKNIQKAANKDVTKASKRLVQTFEKIAKLPSAQGKAPSNVEISERSDEWLQSFVIFWLEESDETPFPTKVMVLDSLYRSPVAERFSNLGLTRRTHAAIYAQFAAQLHAEAEAKPTPFAGVISKWSDGLNENQNATLAALISRSISGNWRASRGKAKANFNWTQNSLKKRSKVLADLALPLVIFRTFQYQHQIKSSPELVNPSRAALSQLPTHDEFSPLLRLELVGAWLDSKHANKAFASARHFSLISDGVSQTNQPWRDRSLCPILTSTEKISEITFDGMQESSAKLIHAFTKCLFTKNDREPVNADLLSYAKLSLAKAAVAAEDMDYVVSVINKAPDYFKGDLKLMLKLASKGHAKIAAKLASADADDYDYFTGIWFTEEDAANLRLLAPALPKKSRYVTECAIASSQDHLQTPPKTNKIEERLIPLAKRYTAEAPKNKRARFLLLQGFQRSLAASTLLKEEYEKLLKSYSLSDTIRLAQGNSPSAHRDSARLIDALGCALGQQLSQGNPAPLKKELRELTSDPDLEMSAAQTIWRTFTSLSAHILLHGAKGPEEAAQLTDVSTELFEKSFSLPGSEHFLTGSAAGLGITIHAMAGKTKEWSAIVKVLPKKHRDTYAAIRKRGGVKKMFGSVGMVVPWYHGHFAEVQQAASDALLNDEWVYTREVRSMSQVWELTSGFLEREHVIKTINALPESHPNRHEYLAAIAVLHSNGPTQDLDKLNKAFLLAQKIAEDKEDFKKLNLYLEIHGYHLAKHRKYAEAIKVINSVRKEHLDSNAKKRIDGYLTSWEKSAKSGK